MKKHITKLLSAVIAGIMLLSAVNVFADSSVTGDEEKLFAALARLTELGITAETSFVPSDTMTRSEMFGFALRANPWYNDEVFAAAAAEKSLSFTDIDESHAAYGQLALMEKLGLVKGDGNGKVRPDDAVTYDEAIAFLVRLTGYESRLDKKAGFPAGYWTLASESGITKGITAITGGYATENDIIIMICNAMDIPLMVMSEYDAQTQETKYVISETRTLATDIVKWEEEKNRNKINPSDEAVITNEIY